MSFLHEKIVYRYQGFLEMRRNMMKSWMLSTGVVALAATALVMAPGRAWAQGATPVPLAKVVVSDTVAQRTLMKMVINSDTARAIVDSCVNWTKQQPGNQSIVIFVLSPTGQIVASQQMDGVLPIGAETGLMKARTALY